MSTLPIRETAQAGVLAICPDSLETAGGLLLIPLHEQHLGSLLEIEKVSYPKPWSEALIRNELECSVAFSYVLEVDGILLGYCFAHLLDEDLEILNLCIAPEMRGHGYASKLLSKILSQAILKGAKLAHLEVRPSNTAALRLYQNFSFKRVAVRPKYYSDNQEDAWIMSSELSARHSSLSKLSTQ